MTTPPVPRSGRPDLEGDYRFPWREMFHVPPARRGGIDYPAEGTWARPRRRLPGWAPWAALLAVELVRARRRRRLRRAADRLYRRAR